MSQTLNHDPAYWRSDAAAERGFDEPPVHPDYLTAATLGITVEDLSEKGGYFLGRTDVRFPTAPVYTGTELHVESEVVNRATSSSRPEYGIVSWRTRGKDAETGDVLCSYERTNMIPRREPMATDGSGERTDGSRSSSELRSDGGAATAEDDGDDGPELPEEFIAPEGGYFEDFVDALEEADDENAAVAYRHERGRTQRRRDRRLATAFDAQHGQTAPQRRRNERLAVGQYRRHLRRRNSIDRAGPCPLGRRNLARGRLRRRIVPHVRRRRRRHRLRLHACSRSRRRRLERGGGERSPSNTSRSTRTTNPSTPEPEPRRFEKRSN